jgi:hypothetical protein
MARGFRNPVKYLREKTRKFFGIDRLIQCAEDGKFVTAYMAWQEILRDEKYNNSGRLSRHGFKVYSQSDEDGIIQEIFNRIGTKAKNFLEIGVGDGIENNTLLLLQKGWSGVWIDGDRNFEKKINDMFSKDLESGRLIYKCDFLHKDNVDSLIKKLIPSDTKEIDFLSVDVDGNDYHLIGAIHSISPRVIAVEYNAKFVPPMEWCIEYDPAHKWDHSDRFGASLKSFELLLKGLGYFLVGCSITGTNAFFVRQDQLGDHFCEDCSAGHHYEPARYWMICAFTSGFGTNLGGNTVRPE